MAAVDFLYHENPPTWAGIEPTTLGADGKRQIPYATQSALAKFFGTPVMQGAVTQPAPPQHYFGSYVPRR
ncbi:hypothetical protein TNCV_2040331 [Trichonephila clavipes]|nr:hypothetical protein TNCV_2040331 [Trichonephila clavipes]